jgi:hypothetical protein
MTAINPPGAANRSWRVGRRLGRTLYLDDECVGMVDTPEIAARIVETMNDYVLRAELEAQTRATIAVREQWAAEMARADRAEANLKMVSVGVDDVWQWQGDGTDHPESLASECPVVMSAGTLMGLVARTKDR